MPAVLLQMIEMGRPAPAPSVASADPERQAANTPPQRPSTHASRSASTASYRTHVC